MKIVLLVSDLRRSRQFYAGLGFRVARRREDGLSVTLGDSTLDLRSDAAAMAGPHYFTPEIERFPRGTGVELTIEAADIDAIFDLARSTDVDVVTPLEPGDDPNREFRVADPDGYFLRFTVALPARQRGPKAASG